jgi:hypothetical protein
MIWRGRTSLNKAISYKKPQERFTPTGNTGGNLGQLTMTFKLNTEGKNREITGK